MARDAECSISGEVKEFKGEVMTPQNETKKNVIEIRNKSSEQDSYSSNN